MAFQRTLTANDLISAATVALAGNQWTEVGRFTVLAGQALALGFGPLAGMDSALGRVYMDLRDNAASPGAAINGRVRLDIENPQRRVVGTLFEMHTSRLRAASASDKRTQEPMPERPEKVGEDWHFVLRVYVTQAVTLGQANSTILADFTEYEVA